MKTILITGATAGFGEAAARKFVAGGWRAIGTGRRGDRLRRLQDELGDDFLPLEIDMPDRAAVESLARLDAPWGEIDLLLNNAGLAPPTDPLSDTDWDQIERDRDQHHRAGRTDPRAAAQAGRAQGPDHQPVSVAATYPYKGGAVYAGTKAFVRQFSLDLAATSPAPGSE